MGHTHSVYRLPPPPQSHWLTATNTCFLLLGLQVDWSPAQLGSRGSRSHAGWMPSPQCSSAGAAGSLGSCPPYGGRQRTREKTQAHARAQLKSLLRSQRLTFHCPRQVASAASKSGAGGSRTCIPPTDCGQNKKGSKMYGHIVQYTAKPKRKDTWSLTSGLFQGSKPAHITPEPTFGLETASYS